MLLGFFFQAEDGIRDLVRSRGLGDVYKRQRLHGRPPGYIDFYAPAVLALLLQHLAVTFGALSLVREKILGADEIFRVAPCLLYTSPSPRDRTRSRMPSSA